MGPPFLNGFPLFCILRFKDLQNANDRLFIDDVISVRWVRIADHVRTTVFPSP
jgi:hypothetical protein